MKTNNIEEQLRLIDEFFEETPQKVIDKMFQDAKAANPLDVSFDEYCSCLGESLFEVMEELSSPVMSWSSKPTEPAAMSLGQIQTESTKMSLGQIQLKSVVMSVSPTQMFSEIGNKGKYDDVASYRNDETETIKAA